jgi:HSP20 family protein
MDGGTLKWPSGGFVIGRRLDGWIAGDVRGEGNLLVPSLRVEEGERGLVVTAAIPGAEKDELSVSIRGDFLRIAGERHERLATADATSVRREQYFSHFIRETRLPRSVDARRTTARFDNGILTVSLSYAHDDEGVEAQPHSVEIT